MGATVGSVPVWVTDTFVIHIKGSVLRTLDTVELGGSGTSTAFCMTVVELAVFVGIYCAVVTGPVDVTFAGTSRLACRVVHTGVAVICCTSFTST